jgi:hypothetical protein
MDEYNRIMVLCFIIFFLCLETLIYISFQRPYKNRSSDFSLKDYPYLRDSEVLYLDFNDEYWNGSDFRVYDISGNQHIGKASNVEFNATGGPFGDGAFEFNGDSDITLPDSPDLSPSTTGQFSVSFWFKTSTFNFAGGKDTEEGNAIHFLGKYSTDNNREWYFRLYNASAYDHGSRRKRISFYVFNPDGGLGAGSYFQDDLKENEWIHIVGVINGTDIFIYKNGILRASNPLSSYNIRMRKGSADLSIGRYSPKYPSFIGSIDDLRIFNKSLSASEVEIIYGLRLK